jgi:hypothetical protein
VRVFSELMVLDVWQGSAPCSFWRDREQLAPITNSILEGAVMRARPRLRSGALVTAVIATVLALGTGAAFADGIVVTGGADTTPPTAVITQVTAEPTPPGYVDDGNDEVGPYDFTIHYQDDLSGVEDVGFTCYDPEHGRSFTYGDGPGNIPNKMSGDLTFTAMIPRNVEQDTYTTCDVVAWDYVRNQYSSTSDPAAAYSLSPPIVVSARKDTTPPEVSIVSIGEPSGNTDDGPVTIPIVVHVQDDQSKVGYVVANCTSQDHVFGQPSIGAGDWLYQQEGDLTLKLVIPQYAAGRAYQTCSTSAWDYANNVGTHDYTLATPIVVQGRGDSTPPVIESITIGRPDSTNTSTGPINIPVSAHITDDLSGVSFFIVICGLSGSGGSHFNYEYTPRERDQVVAFDVVIPQYSPGGKLLGCTYTAYDAAGNSSPDGHFSYDIPIPINDGSDTSAPTVAGVPERSPDSQGWYNHPVTVNWTPNDPAPSSGSPTVPPTTVVNTDGYGQLITSGPSCDPAGNCAAGSYTLNYDATAPTATSSTDRPANAAGWYNAPVTVSLSCTDLLSGVASCPAAQTLSSDGKAQTVSGTATDNAGNSGTVTSDPVNIDQTPPQVSTSLSPATPDGAHGWYVSPVTVSTTCSDALSGVASCSKDQVIASNGASQTRNGAGSDLAGNATTATSAPVNIDGVAPQTTANLSCSGSNGYCTGTTAQLALTATDQGGSGVESIRYRVDGGAWQNITAASGTATITMPQAGTVQVDFYATDLAGNTEPITSLPIRADQTPPVISHALNPVPNADGWTHAATTVHFTATDDFSGIVTITSATTISTDTGPTGTSITGTATNGAGLSASDIVLVKLDTTAPVVSYSITPAAPASGWYTGPVTVHFTCIDPNAGNGAAGSGVASCPADRTVVTDGRNQTLTVTATDIAGNCTTLTTSPLNIDATGPQISFDTADGGTVPSGTTQVSGLVSDPTSGMASYTVTVQKVNKQGKVVPSNTPPTPVTCSGATCTWTAPLGGGSGNPGKPSAYQITIKGTDVAGNTSTATEVVYG